MVYALEPKADREALAAKKMLMLLPK